MLKSLQLVVVVAMLETLQMQLDILLDMLLLLGEASVIVRVIIPVIILMQSALMPHRTIRADH